MAGRKGPNHRHPVPCKWEWNGGFSAQRVKAIPRGLSPLSSPSVCPQDMKKALEACIGRMLEIRHWMVRQRKEQREAQC